jgi:serine/threonine-protein kinase
MALVRGESSLLSEAQKWISWAMLNKASADAFDNPAIEITPEVVGRISPYHTLSGVWATHALISHANGNPVAFSRGMAGFLEASSAPCGNYDLTLGLSGTLLVASALVGLGAPPAWHDAGPLRDLGESTADQLLSYLEGLPEIPDASEVQYLGVAHGWAGMLYALLRWKEARSEAIPGEASRRLTELGELGIERGRGKQWPWTRPAPGHDATYMPGWCNGSAGFVELWLQAERMTGEAEYLELAERAAWNAWEEPQQLGSLCCGLVGRSYALLNFHRRSGDAAWLDRAVVLANRAALGFLGDQERFHSLFKGALGLALLAVDIETPSTACTPFFGDDGWVDRRSPALTTEVRDRYTVAQAATSEIPTAVSRARTP